MVWVAFQKAGGALDVLVEFDLSRLGKGESASHFGLAAKAPATGVEGALQDVWFSVGAADGKTGVRNVTVSGCARRLPPVKPNLPSNLKGCCRSQDHERAAAEPGPTQGQSLQLPPRRLPQQRDDPPPG